MSEFTTNMRLDSLERRVTDLEKIMKDIELGIRVNNQSIQELLGAIGDEKVKAGAPAH